MFYVRYRSVHVKSEDRLHGIVFVHYIGLLVVGSGVSVNVFYS